MVIGPARAGARRVPVTIVTHLLATTLGVQAMGLEGRDRVLAYAFGMGVDVDHAVKAPFYLKAVGLRDKRGYYWRSSLQEPVAFLWIVPLCVFLGSVVPIIFFAVHVAMDYSVRFEKMPFYPYSRWVTRGWLATIPDKVKEWTLASVLVVLNALVFWVKRHV
ncbi:MAG: hypothetical protein DMD33_04090 [Gemmatimonadetes bacterium]|nr:MAG: hypothetical protein DMD33_04090 [Gemmatimonadota bacterium]